MMIEKARDLFSLVEFYVPSVQNSLMEKKIENAKRALKIIEDSLIEYGLRPDYKKYFEEKLQVPLEATRALSEVETQDQRELLQNLFARHISGQYESDGHYTAFIHIINDMDTLDEKMLKQIADGEDLLTCGYTEDELREHVNNLYRLGVVEIYHEVDAPRVDKEMPTMIGGGNASTSWEDTENLTWGATLGVQRVVQVGRPEVSSFGRAFLDACMMPLTPSIYAP